MSIYYNIEAQQPAERKKNYVVTSVRVDSESQPGYDMVHVWNRGGKAGVLVVARGDGLRFLDLLLPPENRSEDAEP